jgi:bifunctional oligoribonuclease and PAP phosphatase NrnA
MKPSRQKKQRTAKKMSDSVDAIGSLLRNSQDILLLSHIRPDGDAIGSVLGLGLSLKEAGKNVQMVLPDGIPSSFRHLNGSEEILRKPSGDFQVVVVLDCADLGRMGKVIDGRMPDLNVDHHITNQSFALLNLVEPESAATSAILANYIPKWGLPINLPVAEALLTGVISDSLGFRTSNVTPKTLEIAAMLMEHGANLPRLYNLALVQRSFEAAIFWGKGLARLQRRDRLVWAILTLEDRKASNYPGKDDADLINILSTIDDTDIAIIFVEHKDGHVKVSWRAQPGWNVAEIALQFGGGGHAAAAGADITGTLEEVQAKVLQATQTIL